MAEKQATPCPRQAHGTMSVQLEHVCVWDEDRWSTRRILADQIRNAKSKLFDWLEKHTIFNMSNSRFYGGTYWPVGEPKPRTCSYCGGVHPDDAVSLIKRGWEVESTTKSYKRYMHPPGYSEAIRRFSERVSDELRWQGPRSPVPPVKVYTYHFSEEQVVAFNAALDAQRS